MLRDKTKENENSIKNHRSNTHAQRFPLKITNTFSLFCIYVVYINENAHITYIHNICICCVGYLTILADFLLLSIFANI